MYAICVCKLVNETVFPIQELSTKLAEHFVFLSVKPQPSVFILPCLLELTFSFSQRRCFQMLCKFLYHLMIAFLFFFWNVCLWDSLFVSRRLALFGTIQKKKNTRISQRVITLLIQRTSGEENYSFWMNGWALSLTTDLVTSFWTFPSIHKIFKKLCSFHLIKKNKTNKH